MTKIFTSAPTLADIHGYKGCVIAKVSSIKKRYNPLEDVWSGGVISEDEVRAVDNKFIAKHKGQLQQNEISRELSSSKEYHVARIAWLMKNPLGEATSASPNLHYLSTHFPATG